MIVDGDGPEILDGSVLRPLQELIVNPSDGRIDEAEAINNLGQIVGSGLHNGRREAFILTPVSETSEPLPLGSNDSTVVWDVSEDWTPPDQPDHQTVDTPGDNNSDDIANDDTTNDDTGSGDTNDEFFHRLSSNPSPCACHQAASARAASRCA